MSIQNHEGIFRMIQFLLNDKKVKTSLPPGSTVLDFVRYEKRLTGTKTGCREGDCGACTVLVGQFEQGQLRYRSMTSCLMPLANAHGKHIVTVEGLNMDQLSPVQQAMVDTNGTQCGFCTLGFVLSFTGFVLHPEDKSMQKAIEHIDGNICRCTGYKSIERAAEKIATRLQDKPTAGTIDWLVERRFLPEYFKEIGQKLQNLQTELYGGSVQIQNSSAALPIGGGTDLLVQKHAEVKHASLKDLLFEQSLKGIAQVNDEVELGASVTVTEFSESPLIQQLFPNLKAYIKLVSSTPIRNMATLAGNLVNASPIGDMTVFLLALDAKLELSGPEGVRKIALKDFYQGYKTLDKKPSEIIAKIRFPIPKEGSVFNFEKVCKRAYLDIASVNTAASIALNPDGTIIQASLSAGGVFAFPRFLQQTADFLTGKKLSEETVAEALQIMQTEVAPISDARGSAEYKRLLLRQLVLAHFEKSGVDLSTIGLNL